MDPTRANFIRQKLALIENIASDHQEISTGATGAVNPVWLAIDVLRGVCYELVAEAETRTEKSK